MNPEWLKLRSFGGDLKFAFEELVCQLARAEKIDNSKFIRVAAPDGGVESYRLLSDGTEYGWQAKFFASVSITQWKQLNSSFKTALDKHPNLTKYFVCLPLDREDPRNEKNWFMDKWNSEVEKWKQLARSKGREIEIEYWGSSEIFDMLSKPQNKGKLFYWFNAEEFSDQWFSERLEDSIMNLDKRYTPELNFELPIAKIFDGLARGKFFKKQFDTFLDQLIKNFNKAVDYARDEKVNDRINSLKELMFSFLQISNSIDFEEIDFIDQEKMNSILEKCGATSSEIVDQFYELDQEAKNEKKLKDEYVSPANSYGWNIRLFGEFEEAIRNFRHFISGPTVTLSNNPSLLINGEAGVGKSHLLADVAKKRLEQKQYTILLLGQHFTSVEPWSQVLNLLHISCDRDTFLSALNSKAESLGSRILIFIDAINEGAGKSLWMKYIAGFVSTIRRHPSLGIVFSVRTSYQKLLIPETLIKEKKLITITHHGFAEHEYDAAKLFFKNYEIKQPSIPLLHPEFSNPLFLKLFCEGLFKQGLHEIPEGHEGISAILNFYLSAINSKLSQEYDLPEELQIVQKIIKQLAEKIAEREKPSFVSYDEAFTFVTSLPEVNAVSSKGKFFQELIGEGLLTQNLFWDEDKSVEGVYIAYERASDHLITSYLIEKYVDKSDPVSSFGEGKFLHKFFQDHHDSYFYGGIIEALSIQLPEVTGQELYEAVPYAKNYYSVARAFVDSIIWRKKNTFKDTNIDYVNEVVFRIDGLRDYFFETIMLVTSIPNHLFNSDSLHKNLMRFSMADRDTWWTQFIHSMYTSHSDEVSPVKRIIEWEWSDENRQSVSDESMRLLAQTTAWFFTSTNRVLRDCATKAMICLLEERIRVLMAVMKEFEEVNDPYVRQRIYAVAYGCAMRTSDTSALFELGNYVYLQIFTPTSVIPDILLRDYAREIIEYAVHVGHEFDFDLNKIRPPYKSSLQKRMPSNKWIDKKYKLDYEAKEFKDYYWSQNDILKSMVTEYGRGMSGYGDFGRYVFESGFRHWHDVDANKLSNLAVQMVFEKYGYDVEKHGRFDRQVNSHTHGRYFMMEERIGKKYQWIAFYELLARVSDNYIFYESNWKKDKAASYDGPWNPYVRDIDPTILIKETKEKDPEKCWWMNVEYSNWQLSNKEWIYLQDDLPDLTELINVVDPSGVEWLVLEIYPRLKEPSSIGEDEWEVQHKNIWYQVRSYLSPINEYENLLKWAKEKDWMGRRTMPESSDRYEMFSREFYWAPCNKTFRTEYHIGNTWSEVQERGTRIGKIAVTALNYLWEEHYDASKKSTLSYFKPTEILFSNLKLNYSKNEGQLLNPKGEMICFDPCATAPSISCLLIRKKELLQMLEEKKLGIFWTVLGEKQMLGGHFTKEEYVGQLGISGIVYFDKGILKTSVKYRKQ